MSALTATFHPWQGYLQDKTSSSTYGNGGNMWQKGKKNVSHCWLSTVFRVDAVISGDQNKDGKMKSVLLNVYLNSSWWWWWWRWRRQRWCDGNDNDFHLQMTCLSGSSKGNVMSHSIKEHKIFILQNWILTAMFLQTQVLGFLHHVDWY